MKCHDTLEQKEDIAIYSAVFKSVFHLLGEIYARRPELPRRRKAAHHLSIVKTTQFQCVI